MTATWRPRLAALLSVLLVPACGGDGPTDPEPASLRFLDGPRADTIESRIVLEVEVAGLRARAVTVELLPCPAPEQSAPCARGQLATTTATSSRVVEAPVERGTARVVVQLGTRAGALRVAARVAGDTSAAAPGDTVALEARPGRPASLAATPGDTALRVGRRYAVGTAAFDRRGNAVTLPAPPSFAARSDAASVDAAGVVTTTAVGRGVVVASALDGAIADTVHVSVVPEGQFAAVSAVAAPSLVLVMANLDGSDYRQLTGSLYEPYDGFAPAWVGRAGVSVTSGPQGFERVWVADTTGSGQMRALLGGVRDVNRSKLAQATPDGSVVVAIASTTQDPGWRVVRAAMPNGPAALLPGQSGWVFHPTPEPGGTRVAYVTIQGALVVVSGSGSEARTIVPGSGINPTLRSPRWSPLGDRIAYLQRGEVRLVRPDGSEDRLLSAFPDCSLSCRHMGLSWSPDAQWLLVRAGAAMTYLLRVADGLLLPLPFARHWIEPAWRP